MNAKELLLKNLQDSLDFCKLVNKDMAKKEELIVAYSYSTIISASIVKKFETISSEDERLRFISELEDSIEEEKSRVAKDNNYFVSKSKGEA